MEIYVMGRARFDYLLNKNEIDDSNVENLDDTFFISILSTAEVPGGNFHLPAFNENHNNVLTVTFDDVIDDSGNAVYLTLDKSNSSIIKPGKAISIKQAEKIIDFIFKNIKKDFAIIHCAAGISRSGAVGAFISDLVGNKYSHFMEVNPYVHENSRVRDLLKKAYNDRIN